MCVCVCVCVCAKTMFVTQACASWGIPWQGAPIVTPCTQSFGSPGCMQWRSCRLPVKMIDSTRSCCRASHIHCDDWTTRRADGKSLGSRGKSTCSAYPGASHSPEKAVSNKKPWFPHTYSCDPSVPLFCAVGFARNPVEVARSEAKSASALL